MNSQPNGFAWVHERGTRTFTDADGVPEGIFYPERPELSQAEWKAEAVAAGRRSWAVIGGRPAWIVERRSTGVKHALRDAPRGYGKRRRQWQQTTQCGQFMPEISIPAGVAPTGRLSDTTCLSCRKVVREWFEFQLQTELIDFPPELEDEYEQFQREKWLLYSWQVQAEWHRPDPVPLWNVPHDLNYSLLGG